MEKRTYRPWLSIYDEKTKSILTENIFVHYTSITASVVEWKKAEDVDRFEYIIPGHE